MARDSSGTLSKEQRVNHWIGWLFTIPHKDVDVQRRGRIALQVVIGLLCAVCTFVPLAMFGDSSGQASLPIIVSTLASLLVAAVIIRSGQVTVGVMGLLIVIIAAISASILRRQGVATTPFYLIAPILVASVMLPAWYIWPVLALTYIQFAVVVGLLPDNTLSASDITNIQSSAVLIGIAAFIGFLGARGAEKSIQAARSAQREASLAVRATEAANTRLEGRVAERTRELQAALALQQEQATALQDSLRRQEQLNASLSALSVPIIPVKGDVLIVPLVGNIEATRVQQLLQTVLQAIEIHRARTVFLDVTGVSTVDAVVAEALLQTAAAARLLGAEPILVGVRPEVAQALGGLGADLSRLRSASSLESGLSALPTRGVRAAPTVA